MLEKLLERHVDPGRVQEVYGRLCQEYARTYYCHRTRNRLEEKMHRQISGDPPSASPDRLESPMWQEEPEGLVPEGITNDPQYKKARELMLVALSDEAARELSMVVGRYTHNQQALLFLADRLYGLGAYDQALRIIRLYFQETLE
jgi:hypothetical protein